MKRIKTGYFERRLEIAKAGLVTGGGYFKQSAFNLLLPEEQRSARNKALLTQQADYFVQELGKLKGSVVKIGQMLALYGEYFLPGEITDSLHRLEDTTEPLEWGAIRRVLESELGNRRLASLEIDETPIAAASLSQVHRAYDRHAQQEICLKIQYPRVAESVDGDFNAVIQLLSLARLIGKKDRASRWLKEIRALLHQELDYRFEAQKTKFVGQMLMNDHRYRVPQVFGQYTSGRVLALSYEQGVSVTDLPTQELSLRRRNHLSEAMLDLFFLEIFQWGQMQTDPNFGNYLVKLQDGNRSDELVLLDFGAFRAFHPQFLRHFRKLIGAAYAGNHADVISESIMLKLMHAEAPEPVLQDFADIIIEIIEPLRQCTGAIRPELLNSSKSYHWKNSRLPRRVAKRATQSSLSRHFAMPPNDFIFLIRKLTGIFSFIVSLDGQFNGDPILKKYLPATN